MANTVFNAKQAAAELGRSAKTLMRWRKDKYGPPYRRIRGRVEYPKDKLSEWLDNQLVGAD